MDPQTEFERVSAKYARTPWWGYVAWTIAVGSVIAWLIITDHSWAFSGGIMLGFFISEYRNYRLRDNARRFANEAQRP